MGFNLKDVMKTAAAPFSCLAEIKAEIAEFAKREDLNGFQKWIASERYVFEPELDFEPKSVIAAAVPFEEYHLIFMHGGKKIKSVSDHIPVSENDVIAALGGGSGGDTSENDGGGENSSGGDTSENDGVGDIGENGGGGKYHFFFDYWLPQKRFAVRSGLAEYGKNNICFVDGMGSLLTLFCFISDMPCPDNYIWREVANMPECEGCDLCINNCPTGAIKKDRFLIDNSQCLSAMNEFGTDPFPDSVPFTAHHRAVHCSRCQYVCPKNAGFFGNAVKTFEFDESETALLLSGKKMEELPSPLSDKIKDCGMDWYYASLPRNLAALFASGNNVIAG